MAVSLGAYVYACGNLHDSPRIYPAPKRMIRWEVPGTDGVGFTATGRGSRIVEVRAAYVNYASDTALAAAIATDDDTKAATPATLVVGGVSFTNVILQAIAPGTFRKDGVTNTWFSADAVLIFEQLSG